MNVYVVEQGAYEQRGIVGAYATPDLAMSSCVGPWVLTYWNNYATFDGVFGRDGTYYKEWACECGTCDGTSFAERVLIQDGPTGQLDHITHQRYVSGMEWAYDTIAPEFAATLVTR